MHDKEEQKMNTHEYTQARVSYSSPAAYQLRQTLQIGYRCVMVLGAIDF